MMIATDPDGPDLAITGNQIRAARRLLQWGQWRLANRARISLLTVARAESEDGAPPIAAETLERIEAVFGQAGVAFGPDDGREAAGARLSAPSQAIDPARTMAGRRS